jgi:hypothetical protein
MSFISFDIDYLNAEPIKHDDQRVLLHVKLKVRLHVIANVSSDIISVEPKLSLESVYVDRVYLATDSGSEDNALRTLLHVVNVLNRLLLLKAERIFLHQPSTFFLRHLILRVPIILVEERRSLRLAGEERLFHLIQSRVYEVVTQIEKENVAFLETHSNIVTLRHYWTKRCI